MNFNLKSGAAASPFAGLFRSGKASAKKAEDDKKDEEMESPEDGDEKEDKDVDKEKGKKAKSEKSDDKECAEDDEEEARAESEDDDEEEKKDEKAKATAAERTRWVSVLSSASVQGKGEAACTMLADTDMTAAQITAVLKGLPSGEVKSSRRSLDERMAGQSKINPGVGDEKPAEGPAATAKAMMAVYDRAVGRSK